MAHSYDYELIALGVCNGDYSQYRIGQAVYVLEMFNATEAQVEEVRKTLEALALPCVSY